MARNKYFLCEKECLGSTLIWEYLNFYFLDLEWKRTHVLFRHIRKYGSKRNAYIDFYIPKRLRHIDQDNEQTKTLENKVQRLKEIDQTYHILGAASRFQATDRRDLIYALLGLISSQFQITADYGKKTSFNQVLIMVAKKMIEIEGNLRVFSISQTLPTLRKTPGLPTWVPNWTIQPGFPSNRSMAKSDTLTILREHVKYYFKELILPEPISVLCVLSTHLMTLTKKLSTERQFSINSLIQNRDCQYETGYSYYIASGPPGVQAGDQIWLLNGGCGAYVLRPRQNGGYTLTGMGAVYRAKASFTSSNAAGFSPYCPTHVTYVTEHGRIREKYQAKSFCNVDSYSEPLLPKTEPEWIDVY
jgi:hypothetical protein